ncbi:hypothetical protein [Streptomyces venezuelae]|uniref:hypothetical protein n=1 Tax=Streptomyces venezuelae TaxID=54571 RepID=UPI0037B2E889
MDDLRNELIKAAVRESVELLSTKKVQALTQAGARYAMDESTARTMVKVAGPLAGVVSTPIIEIVLLARDDAFHDAEDYVEAGMRGVISGAAGAAGGIAFGAVPVVGPVAGPVATVAAAGYVNRRLKESKALEGAAHQVVEVGENVAEMTTRAVSGAWRRVSGAW